MMVTGGTAGSPLITVILELLQVNLFTAGSPPLVILELVGVFTGDPGTAGGVFRMVNLDDYSLVFTGGTAVVVFTGVVELLLAMALYLLLEKKLLVL